MLHSNNYVSNICSVNFSPKSATILGNHRVTVTTQMVQMTKCALHKRDIGRACAEKSAKCF